MPGPDIKRDGDLSYLRKDDLCYKAAIALKQKSNLNLKNYITEMGLPVMYLLLMEKKLYQLHPLWLKSKI